MNFLELIDRLRVSVKNPDEQDKPKALLGMYVNDGYRDVFSRFPFHQARKICTFVTVPGEPKYQLPADVSAVFSISDRTHNRKIFKTGDNFLIDRKHEPQWWPKKYVRYRNYLHLWPIPNGEYVIAIFYKYIPFLLAADTDIPALPEDWHVGVYLRARWWYYTDTGDKQHAADADNAYKLWALDKPTEIEEETVDQDEAPVRPELRYEAMGRHRRFDDGYFDYEG